MVDTVKYGEHRGRSLIIWNGHTRNARCDTEIRVRKFR